MRIALMVAAAVMVATIDGSSETTGLATQEIESACFGADSYTAGKISQLIEITGATVPARISWRQRVHLPAVSPSAIAIVSDSTICAQGLAALNATADWDEGPVSKLYLFSVGNMFVGVNPERPSGEWTQHLVFDSAFVFKGAFLK